MMNTAVRNAAVAAAALTLAAGSVFGQCAFGLSQQENPQPRDEFGKAVFARDGRIAIGAPFDDNYGVLNEGAVTVMRLESGRLVRETTIMADDRREGDRLGWSVSISGDFIIAGAPNHGNTEPNTLNGRGAAWVFRRVSGQWVQDAKLMAPDGAAGDFFGSSVAIFGDFAAVGAPNADVNGLANTGAVYLYRRSTSGAWNYVAKLTAPTRYANAFFGNALGMSGATLAVASHADDSIGDTAGAVFVYRNNNGSSFAYEARLTAADGKPFDSFGIGVSVSNDSIIAGAYTHDANNISNSGAAFVFKRNSNGSWTQQAKLLAAPATANEWFGNSVVIQGDLAVVGSSRYTGSAGPNQGAAYTYRRNGSTWTYTGRLTLPGAAPADYFGSSVGLDNSGLVVVGSNLDDVGSLVNSGSITAFGSSGVDCNGNGQPDACEIASGAAADCNGNGIPDSCESSAWTVLADFNQDCLVNADDLGMLLAAWGSRTTGYDLNNDGIVDAGDLSVLLGRWGNQQR